MNGLLQFRGGLTLRFSELGQFEAIVLAASVCLEEEGEEEEEENDDDDDDDVSCLDFRWRVKLS